MDDSKFSNTRVHGIDYLRAVSSIFVVAWHMNGGGKSLIWSRDHFLEHTFTLSDFINFQIFLLAVPTFIFISTFLYLLKGPSKPALLKRFKRILILVTFWPIAYIIFKCGANGLTNIVPHSITSFFILLLRAGNTGYYFFVSLIICLLAVHFTEKMKNWYQILAFLFSSILLIYLPELAKTSKFYNLAAYWNPLNFIPISFAGIFFAKKIDYIRSKRIILLTSSILLCIIFSIFEWKYYVNGYLFKIQAYAIPAYTRMSILFGVSSLAIIALTTSINTNRIIKFMSKYALALYCLHGFLMGSVKQFIIRITQDTMLITYGSIILVILFSYLIAMVLRIYINEKVLF